MIPAPFTAAMLAEIDHLVVGAGGFARELIAHTGGRSEVKDDHGQRVSAADRLVDRLLRERLVEMTPGAGCYSEEGGFHGAPLADARVFWLVDPVDGTRPALQGGAWAVSAGALVLEGGRPVAAAGWVYLPTLPGLFRALLGPEGATVTLNGAPTHAPALSPQALRNGYLAAGSDWPRQKLDPGPLKLTAQGATAVHLALLAYPPADVAAAFLSRYYPHDAAAGLVIAVAAGCAVFPVDPAGRPSPALPVLDLLHTLAREPQRSGPPVLVAAECTQRSLEGGDG